MTNLSREDRNEQGFTIIELLVTISLSAMASLLMVTAYIYAYGGVLAKQAEATMVQQSQLLLRNLSDDIREGSEIRTSNTITDIYNSGGWTTSDPANIMVITVPALNASKDLVFNPDSGFPYYHEAVYFRDPTNGKMYRRLLKNAAATDSPQLSTCPPTASSCSPDRELVDNVENMLFTFYDTNNNVTNVPEQAKSVEVTINLSRRMFGRVLQASNTTRITLRNEN